MVCLFTVFFIKHFVCDFPLQRAYQYKNKGTYGHPGGILHAAIHGGGILAVCTAFGLPIWLAFADAVIHYHIDWAKIRLNAHWGLRDPDTHKVVANPGSPGKIQKIEKMGD